MTLECFDELGPCFENEDPAIYAFLKNELALGFLQGTLSVEQKINPLAGSSLDGCEAAEEAKSFLLDGVFGGSPCEFRLAYERYFGALQCYHQSQKNEDLVVVLEATDARKGIRHLCSMADNVNDCSDADEYVLCVNRGFQRVVTGWARVVLQDDQGDVEEDICEYVRRGAKSSPRIEKALVQSFKEFNPFWVHFKIIVKSPDAPKETK